VAEEGRVDIFLGAALLKVGPLDPRELARTLLVDRCGGRLE
jgi:hypothetical protein